ncbi:hypothetical protein BDR04DRAFT_1088504 [Suillus decipiens]|nr:hypothetical protein BDR04DRAFT_1088504 [Suillus decipiens]
MKTEQGGLLHGLYLSVTDWTVWSVMAANAIVVSMCTSLLLARRSGTTQPSVTATPPYVFVVIVAFWLCGYSDYKQERFYHIVGS